MTHNTGGPLPCPRCGGKSLHYANCPVAGDETYALSSHTIKPEATMIERVARAMAESSNGGDFSDAKFYGTTHRQVWMDRARAAIAAMREPTKAMCRAPEENGTVGARRSYRAMIDAALQEQSE